MGLVFGSPSFVVSLFLFTTAILAWMSVARGAAHGATIAAVLLDAAHDRYTATSYKFRGTLAMLGVWFVSYLPGAFVTQIWAGSQFSPGNGGGFKELMQWVVLFAVLSAATCLYLLPSDPDAGETGGDLFVGPWFVIFGGWLVGLVWAVTAFSVKGHPEPGDWWVCPAMSWIGVVIFAFHERLEYLKRPREDDS